MNKLKQCPFCASQHVKLIRTSTHSFVNCVDCGARGQLAGDGKSIPDFVDDENAIKYWNTRRKINDKNVNKQTN
jgi:transcription elongation factor Elf1